MKEIYKKYKIELINLLKKYNTEKGIKIKEIHNLLKKLNTIHKLSTDKNYLKDLLIENKTYLIKNRIFFNKSIEIKNINKDYLIDWAVTVGLSNKVELNKEGSLPYVPNESMLLD